MSTYANHDAGRWVQGNITAVKGNLARSKRKPRADGKGWTFAPEQLSRFHHRVFAILGISFGGIYNTPIAWDVVQWRCESGIGVPIKFGHLATFDFNGLSLLVFLCHEARIRVEITTNGPRSFLLAFHQRQIAGDVATRHPNLDEAIAELRTWLKPDHIIHFSSELDGPTSAAESVKADA